MFARFPSAAFLLRPVPLLPTLTRILGERVFLGESYRPPVSGGRRDAGGMRLVSTLFVIIVKSQRKTKRQPTKRRPPHTPPAFLLRSRRARGYIYIEPFPFQENFLFLFFYELSKATPLFCFLLLDYSLRSIFIFLFEYLMAERERRLSVCWARRRCQKKKKKTRSPRDPVPLPHHCFHGVS